MPVTADTPLRLMLHVLMPVLGGLTLITMLVVTVIAIDQAARELGADVRLAMKRANLSLDFVARCFGLSQSSKLSVQLDAKQPFTFYRRFFESAEILASAFEAEFLAIRAERRRLALVRSDVGELIARLEAVLPAKRPMAKAGSVDPREECAS